MRLIWCLMIVAIIISGFPINSVLPINLNISDILYLFILMLIAGEKFKGGQIFDFHLRRYNLFLTFGVYILSLGALLSLFRSYEPINSIFTLLQYLFIFSVLLAIINFLIKDSYENIEKLLLIFLVPTLITQLLVITSGLGVISLFDNYIVTGNGRYQGFSGNPNGFGSEVVLNLVLLYYFVIIKKKKHLLIFIPISYYCIILTASFGALLQLIVLHIILLLFTNIKYKIGAIFFGMFFILILFTESLNMYIPRPIQERFMKTNGEIGSFSTRMELNFLGLEEFFDNPLIGVGFEQFKYYNPYGNVVHNTIISTLVETGFLGLIGLLIILVFPLIRGLMMFNRNKDPLLKYLLIVIMIKISSTAVSGHFISREPWIPILALMIFLSIKNIKDEEVKSIEKTDYCYRQNNLQRH